MVGIHFGEDDGWDELVEWKRLAGWDHDEGEGI